MSRSGWGRRRGGVARLVRSLRARMRDRWVRAWTWGRTGRWSAVRAWSLRWRVTALGALVVALTLVVVGGTVDLSLGSTLTHDQQDRVADRASRAEVLLGRAVAPDDVVSQLDGNGVRVDHRAGNALLAPNPHADRSGDADRTPPGPRARRVGRRSGPSPFHPIAWCGRCPMAPRWCSPSIPARLTPCSPRCGR